MALTGWFAEATTGNVVSPAYLIDGSSFRSELGGSTMTAQVELSRYARSDGSPDSEAIRRVLGLCAGGRHTIVLTDGTATAGEWLIWAHERDADAGIVPITGFQWEQYPKYRSSYRDINVKNTDAGAVHAQVLDDVYNSFQPGGHSMVSVSTPSFGKRIDLKVPPRTAYYGDIVQDIDDMGLAEWRVVPTVAWSGGVPTRVSRRVEYARPAFNAAQPDRLVKPGLGERGGNITSLSRENNYSRLAQTVVGWGAGKGGKQRFAWAQEFGWTESGYIAITKNVNFPGEYSNAQLSSKVEAELAASQSLWEPARITVDSRRMSRLPVLGGRHDVHVGSTWAYPDGWDAEVRVGSIQYQIGTPLVGLEAEEV